MVSVNRPYHRVGHLAGAKTGQFALLAAFDFKYHKSITNLYKKNAYF